MNLHTETIDGCLCLMLGSTLISYNLAPAKAAELVALSKKPTIPLLQAGEVYAGLILAGGVPTHHLTLLPQQFVGTWADAVAWAAELGADLPTRQEQSLLFANAREQFRPDWYWSSEQCPDPDDALVQHFAGNCQSAVDKSALGRARAIRRVEVPHA